MSKLPSASTPRAETRPAAPAAAVGESTPADGAAKAVTRPPTGARRNTRLYAIALGAIAALVVAAIALPRRAPADMPGAAEARPGTQEPSIEAGSTPQPTATPASSELARTAAQATRTATQPRPLVESMKNRPSKQAKRPALPFSAVAAAVTSVPEARDTEAAAVKPAESPEPATAAPASPRPAEAAALDPVTITGCLEVSTDEESFRLTDTEGASAPRGRSWRTGFLKKRSAPVDLVGTSGALRLQRQVGKRVAATGFLTSRELRVSSVRVVAPSCN